MPILNYTACGFPAHLGSCLDGEHSLCVPFEELIWAAITVGRKNLAEVIQHGFHSHLEIIYRYAMVRANLRAACNGFVKTNAYNNLDPSEKSAISYFQGLSLSKLVSQRLFGIPWLVHLDRFSNLPIELSGKGRPDLIGKDHQGRWGVFESKGRTNRVNKVTIRKAREQASSLVKIDGCNPAIRVASISHFSDNLLELRLENADEITSAARDFDNPVGEDQFLRRYYEPFVSLIEDDRSRRVAEGVQTTVFGNRKIDVVRLDEVDLDVGLDSQIYVELTSNRQNQYDGLKEIGLRARLLKHLEGISQPRSEIQVAAPSKAANDAFLGPDGVFVRLRSW